MVQYCHMLEWNLLSDTTVQTEFLSANATQQCSGILLRINAVVQHWYVLSNVTDLYKRTVKTSTEGSQQWTVDSSQQTADSGQRAVGGEVGRTSEFVEWARFGRYQERRSRRSLLRVKWVVKTVDRRASKWQVSDVLYAEVLCWCTSGPITRRWIVPTCVWRLSDRKDLSSCWGIARRSPLKIVLCGT
jgi:hypothetical protein